MYLVIALSQFFEAEVFVFVLKRSFCASVKPRTYKSDLSRQSLSTPERQKSFLSFCFSVHVQSEWQLRTQQESVNCLAKYSKKECKVGKVEKKKLSTRMGFEPTRAEHNGLAVHRLNHSATSSSYVMIQFLQFLLTIYWKKKSVILSSFVENSRIRHCNSRHGTSESTSPRGCFALWS